MWGWLVGIGGWALKLFGGKILTGALDKVLEVIDKRVVNDTEREKIKADVTKKFLDAEVEMAVTRKDAFGGWSKFFAAAFLIGPIVWWNAVFIDSVFNMQWDVLALPTDFYPWMTTIISACFFAPSINGLIGKMFGK